MNAYYLGGTSRNFLDFQKNLERTTRKTKMEWPPVPPPPPVALEEFTVDAASEGSAAAAAAAFNSMGMVVVRGLVPASVAQRAYTQATGSLEQLLATIDKRGVELGVGTKAGWSEVVRRCVCRRACCNRCPSARVDRAH
jgi:hypothetical protein